MVQEQEVMIDQIRTVICLVLINNKADTETKKGFCNSLISQFEQFMNEIV